MDDTPEQLAAALERVWRALRSATREVSNPSGVRGGDLRLLFVLWRHGPENPSALADHLGVTRAVASVAIRRLVDLGLASVTGSDVDRRRRVVALTDAGRALLDSVRDRRRASLKALVGRLTLDEQRRLLALVQKMVDS